MKRGTLFFILVLVLSLFSGQEFASSTNAQQSPITIIFGAPSANALSNTTLTVAVGVTSLYQISTVKAKVEGRETNLTFSSCAYVYPRICNPGYVGTISLAGLPRGTATVLATATDVFNNTATAQTTFRYDQPPRLAISNPLPETVARPNLRVKISCSDDDPVGCNNLLVFFNDFSLVNQPASANLDAELSLAQFQGQSGDLCVRAKDSADQLVGECRTIYVESSPVLTEALSVGGKIWDAQSDRVLFSEKRNGTDVLKIRNRVSGAETELVTLTNKTLPYTAPKPAVYLTPKGAIFVASPTNDAFNNVYEWRDGQLFDLGATDSSSSLQVNGGYAIWTRPTLMVLRDLVSATNTDIYIPGTIGNNGNALLPNGEIVCWVYISTGISHLYRYRNGQITQLTNKDKGQDVYPVSDGKNIVFRRINGQNFDIVLLNESGETVLATLTGGYSPAGSFYQVNNGRVAYTKPGANGGLQVWLRSAAGQDVQQSFFQAATFPDALGPNGELSVITLDNKISNDQWKRYLPLAGQLPVTVGAWPGQAYWRDGQLFIILGGSILQYTPLASVSAANYSGSSLATEAITATFGSRLATTVQSATSQPLPTTLAGTTITVRDSSGTQRNAPLFFVSPTQVNYQVPPGTTVGPALITITSGDGVVSSGQAQIASVSPGIFTANADGRGVPAATLLRVKANGEQIYEPVAMFDSVQNKFVPRLIQLGPALDQVFLILFGTGFRYRSGLSGVSATIRGESVPVLYVGPQNDFVGLDQVNISLPRSLVNRGDVDLLLTVDQQASNAVRIRIE